MKKTDLDLNLLENADEETVKRIEGFTALDSSEKDRIFKLSRESYLGKVGGDDNSGDKVSGVEVYRKPRWSRFAAAAASVLVAAGAVTMGVYLLKGSGAPPENPGSDIIEESSKTAIYEVSGSPFGDLTNEKMLFMTAAVTPYLIDATEEAKQKVAEAFVWSDWTEIDVDTPIPPGETVLMFVYNNGQPYELVFYGDNTVLMDNGAEQKKYQLNTGDGVYSAVWEAARPDDLYDRLIWCDVSDVNPKGVWLNVVTERVEYDMSTKDGIYNKMLNSIDYFDRASGKIVYSNSFFEMGPGNGPGNISYGNNGAMPACIASEFETDLNRGSSYTSTRYGEVIDPEDVINYSNSILPLQFVGEDMDKEIISYCSGSGNVWYSIDPAKKEYDRYGMGIIHRKGSVRDNEVNPDSEDVWYRASPINCRYATGSLHPQDIAYNYLTDFEAWEISGTESFAGRECVVINGTLTGNDSSKLNVVDFVFYVDKETGALLKYLGYDSSGELCDFLITESIAFDSEAEKVRDVDLSEYTQIIWD